MIRRVQKQEKRGLQATKTSQKLQSRQALNAIVLQIQKLHLLHRQHNNILAHQKGVSFCWRRISSAKPTMDPHFLSFFPYREQQPADCGSRLLCTTWPILLVLMYISLCKIKQKKKLLLPLDMAKTFVQQNVKRETETERGLPETPLPTIYSSRFSITLNPWLWR